MQVRSGRMIGFHTRWGIYTAWLLVFIAVTNRAAAQDRLDPQLLRTVVRVETAPDSRGNVETGGGLLMATTEDDKGRTVLITNKHMIGDYNYADHDIKTFHPWVNVFFYREGDPSGQEFRPTRVDILNKAGNLDTAKVYPHPAASIDLVAIDVTSVVEDKQTEHIGGVICNPSMLVSFGKIQEW